MCRDVQDRNFLCSGGIQSISIFMSNLFSWTTVLPLRCSLRMFSKIGPNNSCREQCLSNVISQKFLRKQDSLQDLHSFIKVDFGWIYIDMRPILTKWVIIINHQGYKWDMVPHIKNKLKTNNLPRKHCVLDCKWGFTLVYHLEVYSLNNVNFIII